jgi:lysophospholipase L1-like esterase
MRLPRLRTLLVLAASAVPVVALTASAAVADTHSLEVNRYVALGDSFTSGPFILNPTGSPIGCARSDHNYPSLVAGQLNPGTFVDVSCGGAETTDMTQSQSTPIGTNAPQFDALTQDTGLVTVGIGGNDIGFSGIALECAKLSITDPGGNPCQKHYGDELDQRVSDTAPKVADVLKGIHDRSPNARVVVVGYLRLLPDEQGCWPRVPISAGDVPFLDKLEENLNGMLADQAKGNGADFVDAYRDTDGRDMCASSDQKWVEGIIPSHPAFPMHPNAAGMREVADRVLGTLQGAATAAK